MDAPGGDGMAGGGTVTEPLNDCVNPDHFAVVNGVVIPQPWMQWRVIRSIEADSRAASFAVTGGMNKNDLIHSLRLGWTNLTPVAQQVYGLITRGGARVSLQARSRGYLQVASGYKLDPADAGPLVVASRFGVGADMARSGVLSTGTTFCVIEERMNSVTFPLAPERAGWQRVNPGQSITAKVEVRFLSEQWETGTIDGGGSGSESSYESGGTRLDLFAVPVI